MVSGLHLFDVDHLAAVKDDHMNGLFGSFRQISQIRLRLLSEIELAKEEVPQFDEFESQKVVPGLWILPDVTEVGQRGKQAVGSAFRKFDLRRQVPDADAMSVLSQRLQDQGGPLDRLDQIVWLGGSGHRFVIRNIVSSYSIVANIFVKLFVFYGGVFARTGWEEGE